MQLIKRLLAAFIFVGLASGLSEITSSAVADHSISQIAFKSLAHHGVYRQNLVQTIAGQGISEGTALGVSQIG